MKDRFCNLVIQQGFTFRIYKEPKKLNNVKKNERQKTNELNRQFSKEEMQMANKYMKTSNIPRHKGKADQNYTEIPSHPSQNDHH